MKYFCCLLKTGEIVEITPLAQRYSHRKNSSLIGCWELNTDNREGLIKFLFAVRKYVGRVENKPLIERCINALETKNRVTDKDYDYIRGESIRRIGEIARQIVQN